MALSRKDRDEFKAYLRNCTDRQVQGVYDKEAAARREDYADLAIEEAERRGITIERKAAGPDLVCWEHQANREPIRLPFSIKVF